MKELCGKEVIENSERGQKVRPHCLGEKKKSESKARCLRLNCLLRCFCPAGSIPVAEVSAQQQSLLWVCPAKCCSSQKRSPFFAACGDSGVSREGRRKTGGSNAAWWFWPVPAQKASHSHRASPHPAFCFIFQKKDGRPSLHPAELAVRP